MHSLKALRISLERVIIWLHIRPPYLTLTSLIFRVSEGRSAVIRKSFITPFKFLTRNGEMAIPTQESREIDIALFGASISRLQGPVRGIRTSYPGTPGNYCVRMRVFSWKIGYYSNLPCIDYVF